MFLLSRTWKKSSGGGPPAVKPLKLRLPYNALFLPEYFSTLVLSALISWFFLSTVNGGGLRGHPVSHVVCSTLAYLLLALGLLWMTWRHRVVYSDILFHREADGTVRVRIGREWIDLEHLDAVEETVGWFFGRRARVLYGRDGYNGLFEVNDCLSGFDQLKRMLSELRDIKVRHLERHSEQELQAVKERWQLRHRLFPPAFTPIDAAGRFGFRMFCVLPVAVVDIAINAVLHVLLQNGGRGVLILYIAPLSLLASAFIARYVYYYLFTSTRLNRRIG